MKKLKFLCAVLAAMLLLTACSKSDPSVLSLDTLFYRTEASLAEGHLFFAGRVVSATQQNRAITYYDSETEANTFYEVEVTEDFFGCLPARTLTVCVMGTDAHFVSRTELRSDTEYLFDVNAWAGEDEMLFLLPTFYEALPQREGEYIYYTKGETRYAVEGDYAAYKQALFAMAEEQGYGPAAAWNAIQANLQSAAKKDAAYFKELKFEAIDKEAIGQVTAFAADRLAQIKTAPKAWAEIQEVLK